MIKFLRGALIEYKSDFLGPIPNVVLFQFNPESLSRTIQIPTRTPAAGSKATAGETAQAGTKPYERISLTAHFSAADYLNMAFPPALLFGVGTQLAALEKMVLPLEDGSGAAAQAAAAVDAAAAAVSGGSSSGDATTPTPRQRYPNILFVWGLTKVLPVIIDTMSINEKQFDSRLNPVQAEVSLGLSVMLEDLSEDDPIARGAAEYSKKAKDVQAIANLANVAVQPIIDIIPF